MARFFRPAAAQEEHMRYVMLIYENSSDIASRGHTEGEPYLAAWRAYHKALVEAGAFIAGAPLMDSGTATTIRMKGGKRHIQDGPFAESKDQLGGFSIVDFESLDAAIEWAARCPAAATGAVEVRPMDVNYHDMVGNP